VYGNGRPANDGPPCLVCSYRCCWGSAELAFIPLDYDHQQIAAEMRDEELPQEFITAIETGWWTTCLEVLPPKERPRGIY
jgi:hypothetical protein